MSNFSNSDAISALPTFALHRPEADVVQKSFSTLCQVRTFKDFHVTMIKPFKKVAWNHAMLPALVCQKGTDFTQFKQN